MDSKIDHLKEEVDFSDNNDKVDKLKKSYLILKQKVCRSHDLIKLYNDKLKECERIKIDLDLANKETKKMTTNYNLTLAKVIKLELQNTEYKKDIESLSNTIAAHETKMAGDRQHLQQLMCKMKELEETHLDKIMQLDLDKSMLQENIKELKCQLKVSNKNADSFKRKTNKKQQNIECDECIHSENSVSTADIGVNTESDVSTADVAVNTVGDDMKLNATIEKSIMTDISCNIDKNDPFPLFCNKCESILSNPYEKICRSMTNHPQLIEIILSPIKALRTESISTNKRDGNLTNCYGNNDVSNFEKLSENTNTFNNSSNLPSVSLKPELSSQDHHIIRSKSFADLATNPIPLSNQFNGLSNAVQTPCLISESNNLNNLTTSINSVHVLERLEEKMRKLEKKIKKQSRKKKQLTTNHLQYFPHMNFYPNNVLSQNLSLNMASAFWNEVKNLMDTKQNKYVENPKKRHESKLCKFSSKKVKLKHCLKQKNMLLRNNAWNIDSITSCPITSVAVNNPTATDYLESASADALSNSANNNTVLDHFSTDINMDKDKSCDALIEENAKTTILSSTPKKTSWATNIQDEDSSEFSSCRDIRDSILNSIEDTNSSDSSDTQCYTPAVKKAAKQKNDVSFNTKTLDTNRKKHCKNKIVDIAATNDAIMTNDIVATTTSEASTASTNVSIDDKFNESATKKQTSISSTNELSDTECTVKEMSCITNNVQPNAWISNSIDEHRVNDCAITAANNITVANTSPTTTTNVSISYCGKSTTTTTSTRVVTRAQKRKFQNNLQTDSLTVKKTDEIYENKIRKETSENGANNQSDTFKDCTTRKKQRIAHEVKIVNNQEASTQHSDANQVMDDVADSVTCKANNSDITRANLNKSNNCTDTPKVNSLISKEGKSPEASSINPAGFTTNVHNNECIEEQSGSIKAGHSNTRIKSVDLNTKSAFPIYKSTHLRLMDHLKHLKSRPQCKISDLELFHSSEPIVEDNQNNNQSKSAPQVVHNKNSEIKNNENNFTPQLLCNENGDIKHNEDKVIPLILCNQNNEMKLSEDKCIPHNIPSRIGEIKHNEDKLTPHVLSMKDSVIKSYSNVNGKDEYKLQSKSVDLSIQKPDETSQQDECDSDNYQIELEKNDDVIHFKEQSGLQKIIEETQKVSRINDTSKINQVNIDTLATITDVTMHNENNICDVKYNMETIFSNKIYTKNIDKNTSEITNPITLLKNHFNQSTKPKGVRTTKKALKEMAQICRATENFIKRQLNRIICSSDWGMAQHTEIVNKLSSACTVRIVANGIVEFMLERGMNNLDKTYTPPAPLMTVVQQRIVALLVDLEAKMPTVISFVQAGIEYKVFRLNKTPMYNQVQNLIRLYVVLARIQKDREKVRILCCDALYCLGLHAIPVFYTALTSWPEIFPQFTEHTAMLPKCMAHIISSCQAVDFPQLHPLKNLISSYYKFKAGNHLSKNLMEELLNSFERNHSSTGLLSLKTAIILLAKKEGTSWTYKNIIQAHVLPKIVQRKYSSMFEAFRLLGHLLRVFPVEDNEDVKEIINQLTDLVESGEGSEDLQEGMISALLSLCRHDFDKVAECVLQWTPKMPMREFTIQQYAALFSLRTTMHWKGFMKHTLNKI